MMIKRKVKTLNVRLDADLFDRFNAYCDDKGQTKTVALARILKPYLDEYEKTKGSGKKA